MYTRPENPCISNGPTGRPCGLRYQHRLQVASKVETDRFNALRVWVCVLGCLSSLLAIRAAAEQNPPRPAAAVFSEALPGLDTSLAREVAVQVLGAGSATEFVGVAVLTNRSLLTAARYDL